MEPSAFVHAERHDNIEAIYKKLTERRHTADVAGGEARAGSERTPCQSAFPSPRWTPLRRGVGKWHRPLEVGQLGTPRSVVVAWAGPDGRNAFLNNGDYNHGSGVLSRARFEVGTEGLTLEAEGLLAFTGGHWQIWQAGLEDPPPEVEMQEYAPRNVRLNFTGASPTERNHGWTCGRGRAEWMPEGKTPPWHRFTIQVRPDGIAECYVDGRVLFQDTIPVVGRQGPLVIMLRGHSVNAKIYHGRLVLTRGLRY
jgi:hypothetical protein